ncbi:hypothetical protein [Brevibacillus fortis]|uniref:Tail fiber protein n=1 Tax=Brevibacillus fortis TaxID=2126352 RepID=A0A2P7V3F1_9BACL|nr:hypothetical protein [Brevibacillus fortis]PSJ93740.1 hypothetical protein C7R93_17280 [Brevibacillus fortis]
MISDILRDHGMGKGINGVDRKALIDIANAADTNQSVVKTIIINNLKAKDPTLAINASSTWADIIAAIPNLYIGKKWATGTVAIPGSSGTNNEVTVTGLGFVPKTIFAFNTGDATSSDVNIHCYTACPSYSNPIFTGWKKVDNWSVESNVIAQSTAPTTNSFKLRSTGVTGYTNYIRWFAIE